MTEVVEKKALVAKKLVLGFDAGCMTCSGLARKIEEEVGDKLEVRSLHDPQMVHWREQALGEDAPWAPTLVEVNGGEIKAWTGLKMALVLSRRLGPVGTWRVMQLVGEIKSAPKTGTASSIGLSRGKFIKGLGGAALGIGVLSATGNFASPAHAANRAPEDEVDFEELSEALSAVEELPRSVIVKGEKEGREWLGERLGIDAHTGSYQTQRFRPARCAYYIGVALVTGYIPWLKILRLRRVIRKLGGRRQFIFVMRVGYVRGRQRGFSRWRSIRFAAKRVARITGINVVGAILSLFYIDSIWCNCVPGTCR